MDSNPPFSFRCKLKITQQINPCKNVPVNVFYGQRWLLPKGHSPTPSTCAISPASHAEIFSATRRRKPRPREIKGLAQSHKAIDRELEKLPEEQIRTLLIVTPGCTTPTRSGKLHGLGRTFQEGHGSASLYPRSSAQASHKSPNSFSVPSFSWLGATQYGEGAYQGHGSRHPHLSPAVTAGPPSDLSRCPLYSSFVLWPPWPAHVRGQPASVN